MTNQFTNLHYIKLTASENQLFRHLNQLAEANEPLYFTRPTNDHMYLLLVTDSTLNQIRHMLNQYLVPKLPHIANLLVATNLISKIATNQQIIDIRQNL